jgi:hypothetical protein
MLPFDMGGSQCRGILVVARPMPPQSDRQPIRGLAPNNRFKSATLAPFGHDVDSSSNLVTP